MKQKSKKKGQRKSRKKGGAGKFFLFLIIIGVGLFLAYHFRHEIFDSLKPLFEKKPEKKIVVKEKRVVTLYFSEEEGEYLVGEKREIPKKESVEEEAKEAIIELIRGPRGELIPTLPSQTELLDLQLDQRGLARVNFNRALTKNHPGGSSAEMMTVYSVVNSLTFNFPNIKRVQFLVEGKQVETIAGHLSLRQSVPPKPDLIKKAGKK
jgi:spore germination protein GerM